MYLAFDTETTGLPREHLELSHDAQPHILQFAGIVFDQNGQEIDRLITYVKPGPNAVLFPAAYMAHGISLDQATEAGMEPHDVFGWFTSWTSRVSLIIGHNVGFDLQAMRILASRSIGQEWEPPCPTFCTMKHAAPKLNLPPTARMIAAGRNNPKPPTLTECVRHFFGEDLTGAHDAGTDVGACIRIFELLKEG